MGAEAPSTTFKGLELPLATPTFNGGKAIKNNFITIANQIEALQAQTPPIILQGGTSGAIHSDNLPTGVTEADLGADAIDIQSARTVADDIAAAAGSIAIGKNVKIAAADTDAIAIGTGAATGFPGFPNLNCIAIGKDAATFEQRCVAIGFEAAAWVAQATALGYQAIAQTADSVAVGVFAECQTGAVRAVAIGCRANARGPETVAIGKSSLGKGDGSVALGTFSHTEDDHQLSILNSIVSPGSPEAMAIGHLAVVNTNAVDGIAIGTSANVAATHARSVALGRDALTTAADQIMLGTAARSVVAPGNASIAGSGKTLGFYGVTGVGQATKISDPGAPSVDNDVECRAQLALVIDALEGVGIAAAV